LQKKGGGRYKLVWIGNANTGFPIRPRENSKKRKKKRKPISSNFTRKLRPLPSPQFIHSFVVHSFVLLSIFT